MVAAISNRGSLPVDFAAAEEVGRFDAEVAAYFAANATSPFIEDLADGFLEYLSGDENADVASLASLERDALFGVEARIP